MKERSTQPTEIEGVDGAVLLWQPNQIRWSFSPQEKLVSWPDASQNIARHLPSANQDPSSTTGPQKITPPERKSVAIDGGVYGKRGFQVVHQWEGVVESVGNNNFQCRITPVVNGSGDGSKVELTDFSFEDLSNESDESLVVPGAVFYWTIGRSRNAAGTVTNLSLVRFRRLPAPTTNQNSEADEKAAALVLRFGEQNGSSSASA